MARPDSARKSEGLGAKIWPDGRVWAYNKWPKFFGTGLGFAFGPRTGPARKEVCCTSTSRQKSEIKDYGLMEYGPRSSIILIHLSKSLNPILTLKVSHAVTLTLILISLLSTLKDSNSIKNLHQGNSLILFSIFF